MNLMDEQATSFSATIETAPAIDLSTPKFVLLLGRGRGGKSLLARWLVGRARSQRRDIIVADADRINPSLAPYFQDALCLSGHSEDEILDWFSAVFSRQFTEKLSSVVDLGPGATPLEDLSALGVLSFLGEAGIQPVAVHLVGTNPADLSYLPYLDKLLPSAATIIVLNKRSRIVHRRTLSGRSFHILPSRPPFSAARKQSGCRSSKSHLTSRLITRRLRRPTTGFHHWAPSENGVRRSGCRRWRAISRRSLICCRDPTRTGPAHPRGAPQCAG